MNSPNTISSIPNEILDIALNPVFRDTFLKVYKKVKRKSTPTLQEGAYKAFLKVLEGKAIESGEFFTLYNLFSGDTDVISGVFESLEKTKQTEEVIPSDFDASVRADLHLYAGFYRNFFETHVRLILEGKITESSITPLGKIGKYTFSKITELESLSDNQYVMQDATGNIIYGFEIYSQTQGKSFEAFEKSLQDGMGDFKILFEETVDDKALTHILSMEHGDIELSVEGYKVSSYNSGGEDFGVSFIEKGKDYTMRLYSISQAEIIYELTYNPKNNFTIRDIYSNGGEILMIFDSMIQGIWYSHIYSVSRGKDIYKDFSDLRQIKEIEVSQGETFAFIFNNDSQSYELFDIATGSFIFGEDTTNADFFAEGYTGLIIIDEEGKETLFDQSISTQIKNISPRKSETGYQEFLLELKDKSKKILILKERFEKFSIDIITHPAFIHTLQNGLLGINKKHLPEGFSTKDTKKLLTSFINGTFSETDFGGLYTLLGHIPLIKIISDKLKKSLKENNDTFGLKLKTFFSAETSEEKLSEELRLYLLSKFITNCAKNGTFFHNFESEGEVTGYKIFSVTSLSEVFIGYSDSGILYREVNPYIHENSKTFIIEDGNTIIILQNTGKGLELVEKIEGTLGNIYSNPQGCNLEIYTESNQTILYDALKRKKITEIEFGDISGIESLENGYLIYFTNEKGKWGFVFFPDTENDISTYEPEEYEIDSYYTTSTGDVLLLGENDDGKIIIISRKYGTILHNSIDFIDFSRNDKGKVVLRGSYLTNQPSFSIEIKDIKSMNQPSK